ncbi:MAG: S-methyl-5-thioribose-1-phosphate isomerase, partial [Candidatus Scalindua sp.]
IPIEERNSEEITHIMGNKIAPDDIKVFNPAFDVTPAKNITAIVTEKGVINNPDARKIKDVIGNKQ